MSDFTVSPDQRATDIVIPLGHESRTDNDELRLALRSIERFGRNVGRILLVTDNPPEWIANVTVIPVPDVHRHNKDANLIDKLLAACRDPELSERFLFWSDDQLALQEFDAATLPVMLNSRGYADFPPSGNRWHQRMRRTFEYLAALGKPIVRSFEAHTPQPWEKTKALAALPTVDYQSGLGYCVNSLYYGLTGATGCAMQNQFKVTWEHDTPGAPLNKLFVGYNDDGFLKAGLREKLFAIFPRPSHHELPAPAQLTAVTPTGDRPEQLATVIAGINRQRRRPDLWLIADDGRTPIPQALLDTVRVPVRHIRLEPSAAHTLARNFALLLGQISSGNIAVIEDDDYYPAGYLARVEALLATAECIGVWRRRYYNLGHASYFSYHNASWGSLHGTSFRATVKPAILAAIAPGFAPEFRNWEVDAKIWKRADIADKRIVDFGPDSVVGLKNWPTGRAGTTAAHRNSQRFTPDLQSQIWREWLGDDAKNYENFRSRT